MVKWWSVFIAMAVGLVGGFIVCFFGIATPASESVRYLETRITDAENTSHAIELTNSELARNNQEQQRIIERITTENSGLKLTNRQLAESNQRTIDELGKADELISGIVSGSADIAETIDRCIAIVTELAKIYRSATK